MCTNFAHFERTNEMKPRDNLCSTWHYFQSLIPKHTSWTKIYRNFSGFRGYSTEHIESLQTFTVSYSCQQNATDLGYIEQTLLSYFDQFVDEQFQFYLCHKFHSFLHYWFSVPFKVKNIAETAKLKCHSYLVPIDVNKQGTLLERKSHYGWTPCTN